MILELTDAQKAFQQQVAQFAPTRVAPRAAAIDEQGAFPRDLVREAASLGLMGVTVGGEWGGAGKDYVSYALAVEALANASAVVAVIAAVNNSLVVEPIARFGSDAQKQTWLPAARVRRGARRIRAVRGTCRVRRGEPADGRAARRATATRSPAGRCGSRTPKRRIWSIVFAATQPGLRGRGVSAFLVPMDSAGITRVASGRLAGRARPRMHGSRARAMSASAPTALLGAPGEGFRIAMWALEGGRVAIAAQALGVGEAALAAALDHARIARGVRSAHRQLPGDSVDARRHGHRARRGADADDEGGRSVGRRRRQRPLRAATPHASMAKLFASEAAHRAADKAMQILASKGYRRGSVVERLFRDVRATEIYQGTSEVQRMVIAEHILQ